MIISKLFKFEAAHYLPGHEKCGQTHGHGYKTIISLDSPINKETGMVVDFSGLKKSVDALIIDYVDHKTLNDIFDFIPTAENIAIWIFQQLYTEGWKDLYSVTVWETDTSSVTCKRRHLVHESK